MARVAVKVSHPIAGGHLGSLIVNVDYARTQMQFKRIALDEQASERMPDGSARVMRQTVKRHVWEFLKDTRYCFTSDPESGFECEMRVL